MMIVKLCFKNNRNIQFRVDSAETILLRKDSYRGLKFLNPIVTTTGLVDATTNPSHSRKEQRLFEQIRNRIVDEDILYTPSDIPKGFGELKNKQPFFSLIRMIVSYIPLKFAYNFIILPPIE